MLFAEIFVASVLFLLAWAYVIFDLPSVFFGAAGLSFSCLGIFLKRILVIGRGEEIIVRIIS
jgi:hypothetical protein